MDNVIDHVGANMGISVYRSLLFDKQRVEWSSLPIKSQSAAGCDSEHT
jgi:aspartate carbamoyltransferase regulatory subunit